jgi:hypothetical protein
LLAPYSVSDALTAPARLAAASPRLSLRDASSAVIAAAELSTMRLSTAVASLFDVVKMLTTHTTSCVALLSGVSAGGDFANSPSSCSARLVPVLCVPPPLATSPSPSRRLAAFTFTPAAPAAAAPPVRLASPAAFPTAGPQPRAVRKSSELLNALPPRFAADERLKSDVCRVVASNTAAMAEHSIALAPVAGAPSKATPCTHDRRANAGSVRIRLRADTPLTLNSKRTAGTESTSRTSCRPREPVELGVGVAEGVIDAVSVADELLDAAADLVNRALDVDTALPAAACVRAALAVASREPWVDSDDKAELERVDENVILRVDDADSAAIAETACVLEAMPDCRELALADDERESALVAESRVETPGELEALEDELSLVNALRVGAAARVAGSDGFRKVGREEEVDTAPTVRDRVATADRDFRAVSVRDPVGTPLNDADDDLVGAPEIRDEGLAMLEAADEALPPEDSDAASVPAKATLAEPDEDAERDAKEAEDD